MRGNTVPTVFLTYCHSMQDAVWEGRGLAHLGTVILYTWPSRQVRVVRLGGKPKAVRFTWKYKCIYKHWSRPHKIWESREEGRGYYYCLADTLFRADLGTNKLKGWKIKLKDSWIPPGTLNDLHYLAQLTIFTPVKRAIISISAQYISQSETMQRHVS